MKLKSNFERGVWNFLEASGVQYEYESQVLTYKARISGVCDKCSSKEITVTRRYIPDWNFLDGKLVVETKGKFDAETRTKMLCVIESNPDIEFRLLFMRDNWLTRTKKKRYTDWCRQKGITCAVGSFPEEWLREIRGK